MSVSKRGCRTFPPQTCSRGTKSCFSVFLLFFNLWIFCSQEFFWDKMIKELRKTKKKSSYCRVVISEICQWVLHSSGQWKPEQLAAWDDGWCERGSRSPVQTSCSGKTIILTMNPAGPGPDVTPISALPTLDVMWSVSCLQYHYLWLVIRACWPSLCEAKLRNVLLTFLSVINSCICFCKQTCQT